MFDYTGNSTPTMTTVLSLSSSPSYCVPVCIGDYFIMVRSGYNGIIQYDGTAWTLTEESKGEENKTGVTLTIGNTVYAVFAGGYYSTAVSKVIYIITYNGTTKTLYSSVSLNTPRYSAIATHTKNIDGTNAILFTGGFSDKEMTTPINSVELLTYTLDTNGTPTFKCTLLPDVLVP